MVTNVVTGVRTAGNIRGSKRTMPRATLRGAPQGWSRRLCSLRLRPPGRGCDMEEIKVADSRALEVVAREPDPKLSENAMRVLRKRYLKKDDKGHVVETPKELFARVAWNLAQAERNYGADEAQVEETARRFFRIIANLDFLPNSPTLMNAGLELQLLSACFVLPVDDSLVGIFDALKQQALIHQGGGGTGFAFSRLRPKGDFVKSTMGVASGPVSFMKIFDASTQTVKQGGKRRGANMGILRVDHPDILEFITCKDRTSEVTNFNISVAITDKFMDAVKAGTPYDLVNPRNHQVVGQLDARRTLDKIAFQAWKNGEPGLFFIDENSRRQPTPNVGEMEATNPCGEEPLLPYESCNLGSIDLQRHLKRDARNKWEVDWEKLERTTRTAVRALDNVIDMSAYPIKEIEEMTDATRKIGLGVMGFARVLFALEVPYDSKEGVEWGRKIMKFIQEIGYDESTKLAEERGTYPAWEGSRQWEKGLKVRNSYVTTVAPTGTISMIADTSGGCEPEFSLIWYKRVMDGDELPYFLDYFEEVAKREGFWRDDLVQKILDNHGSPRGLKDVPEKWQRVFATAHDVSPEWHVRMQAGFQDYSDAAVSKTINLPREATVEDVKKAYLLAYELKCKGMTVYRDGSREDQVLNIGVAEAEKPKAIHVEVPAVPAEPAALRPRPRPDVI